MCEEDVEIIGIILECFGLLQKLRSLFSHHLGTADVWLLLESDKEHLENK